MSITAKPLTHCLVSINKAFEDEITLDGGVKLFLDPTYNKSQHVICTGKIAALPIKPPSNLKRALKNLAVGDEICFSFRVCADITHNVTEGFFTETTNPEEKFFKRYTNSKQEWITVVCIPTSTNFTKWVGTYVDANGELVEGVDGSEGKVFSWLQKFNFISEDKFKFNNLLGIDGEDVWKVGLDEIFAKKAEDGSLVPVGERVLLKPIDIDIKHRMEIMKGIHLPQQSVAARFFDRAELLHDYPFLDLRKGDTVAFRENFVEKYTFYNEEYWLLKPARILGKWSHRPTINNVM